MFHPNRLYFDFNLNCGIESYACVLILISIPFFKVSMEILIWEHMTNLTRPVKDVFVSYHTKIVKYKLEFPYSEFKKPEMDLEYVINEADINDEVDVVGKLLNFSEQKVSNAANKYIECTIVERLLEIFGDQLIRKVKDNPACNLIDLKVVLGSNQRKVLHTTSSTTCIDVDDENVAGYAPKESKLLDSKQATLEGTVISIDMSSLTVKRSCTKCSTFVEIASGFYCFPSCNMMCTMESVAASKPKISLF